MYSHYKVFTEPRIYPNSTPATIYCSKVAIGFKELWKENVFY